MANLNSLEHKMIQSIMEYMNARGVELQAESDAKNIDYSDLDYDSQAETIGFLLGVDVAEVINAISHELRHNDYAFDEDNFRFAVKKYIEK